MGDKGTVNLGDANGNREMAEKQPKGGEGENNREKKTRQGQRAALTSVRLSES